MVSGTTTTFEEHIRVALAGVPDPEIPAVSVLDMGMIRDVLVEGDSVTVTVLPTFTGCPAIDVIKADVARAVEGVDGVGQVTIEVSFDPPWTSERITEDGRKRLREFGISPPTGNGPVLITDIGLPTFAVCPFCGSRNTKNENAFGPTPCRALYHCSDCKNPFEQFKPV